MCIMYYKEFERKVKLKTILGSVDNNPLFTYLIDVKERGDYVLEEQKDSEKYTYLSYVYEKNIIFDMFLYNSGLNMLNNYPSSYFVSAFHNKYTQTYGEVKYNQGYLMYREKFIRSFLNDFLKCFEFKNINKI